MESRYTPHSARVAGLRHGFFGITAASQTEIDQADSGHDYFMHLDGKRLLPLRPGIPLKYRVDAMRTWSTTW
jgi:hypothetical protein